MNDIIEKMAGFLEFKNVSKIYPTGVRALQGVNLSFRAGEFAFLFGPTGAGKTTLLKLVTREERPTVGEVWLSGRRISHLREKDLPFLRRGLGVIFQDLRLVPEWTVLENLMIPLEVLRIRREEVLRRAQAMLRFLQMERKRFHLVEWLSGGEKQRLSLGRALIHRPSLVLADEPTGNMDAESAYAVIKVLFEFAQREKATVIIATHDQSLLDAFPGRVVTLEKGRIIHS